MQKRFLASVRFAKGRGKGKQQVVGMSLKIKATSRSKAMAAGREMIRRGWNGAFEMKIREVW